MRKTRMITSMVVTVALLACAIPMAAVANGKSHSTTKAAAKKQPVKSAKPPVGRGPGEPAPAASLAQINERGRVNSMAEAEIVMNALVAQHGGMGTFGDYKVAYMVDPPHGWYEMMDGVLTWRPPAPNETQHLEAVVLDALTNKPVPMTGLTMDVVDGSGNVVQSLPLIYYWHPMADHYANNFAIPTAGAYTLRVRGPAPDIRRHNIRLGNRFTLPLDASFPGVQLTPKQPDPADLLAPPAGVPVAPAGSGAGPLVAPPVEPTPVTPTTPGTGTGDTPVTPAETPETPPPAPVK